MGTAELRPEIVGDDQIPLYSIRSTHFKLTFAPTLGGRLLSLRFLDSEMLWINPTIFTPELRILKPRFTWPELTSDLSSWPNPGGAKTWPAPQGWSGRGEWAGPPDPILDTGDYGFTCSSNTDRNETTVEMRSEFDPRTGLRITRLFTIPADGYSFHQRTILRNESALPVRWSPWEVVQIDSGSEMGVAGTGVVIATDDDSDPVDLGTYYGTFEIASGSPARIAIQDTVAKRGWPVASGDIRYVRADAKQLALQFDPVETAHYPDGGSRAEVWMQAPTPTPLPTLGDLHPQFHLVELEVLGPLVNIAPGESTSHEIRWVLHPG